MGEKEYKSVAIVNDTNDAQITLYIYPSWDLICWLSWESKIIKANTKYLYRSQKNFQFKLVARYKDKSDERPATTLRETAKWKRDELFKITNGRDSSRLHVHKGDLADYPQEKRICQRMLQRDKELKSTAGGRNFYEILGENMADVRRMPREEQNKILKEAWHRECLRWHPDRNGGDDEVFKEIQMAYSVLRDEVRRADYNNLADYDSGWLSLKRYKAIFNPECVTKEQKQAQRNRLISMALSAVVSVGGILLTGLSAGAASPMLATCGAAVGGGFLGAGLQAGLYTLDKTSVVDGVSWKDWALKASFGFVGGAVTGGAAAGITGAVTGLGSTALESTTVTMGQYVGIGAGTGAVGGVASSLASDAGRKFVDGEDITWKQAAGRALGSGVIGAVAGVAGGAVTKAVVGAQMSAAAANLEGEIAEQVAILTGARRLCNALSRNVSRMVTETGIEAAMGTPVQFIEERVDDSVENRSPGDHVADGLKNVAGNIAKGLVTECSSATLSHALNEAAVDRRSKHEVKTLYLTEGLEKILEESPQDRRGRIRFDLSRENNEHLIDWRRCKSSAKYTPLVNKQPFIPRHSGSSRAVQELLQEDPDGTRDGRVKYICEGTWISKMMVSYLLKENEFTTEVEGSGKAITIPAQARSIKVRFQVKRLFWLDIKKYDRFRKCWYEPYRPHVFRYASPPIRTFTIEGNPWLEAVTRVSNEYHEETGEL